MDTKTQDERCKVCGRVVLGDKAHVAITQVEAKKDGAKGPRPKHEWGVVHKACFARWTGRPADLLEVLSEREQEIPVLQG